MFMKAGLVNCNVATPQDRRAYIRIRTIYRSAKVIGLNDAGLCLVLNLSDGGALIETTQPFEKGDLLSLELADGETVNGAVAWRDGSKTGIEFSPRIDCVKMIKKLSEDRWNGRGRPVRLAVKGQVEVTGEFGTRTFDLRDVSPKGLKLRAEGKLRKGMHVRIRFNPDLLVDGEVCWVRNSEAGIELCGQIAVLELGSAASFAKGQLEATKIDCPRSLRRSRMPCRA